MLHYSLWREGIIHSLVVHFSETFADVDGFVYTAREGLRQQTNIMHTFQIPTFEIRPSAVSLQLYSLIHLIIT